MAQFLDGLEVTFTVGKEPKASFGDRTPVPHARKHVLERPSLGDVVVHIIDHNQRSIQMLGKPLALLHTWPIVRPVQAADAYGQSIVVKRLSKPE